MIIELFLTLCVEAKTDLCESAYLNEFEDLDSCVVDAEDFAEYLMKQEDITELLPEDSELFLECIPSDKGFSTLV